MKRSQYKKIKPALTEKAIAIAEMKTGIGGKIEMTVWVPAAMSSLRAGARPIGFDDTRFNISIKFKLDEKEGWTGVIRIENKKDVPAANHSPTFSGKTRDRLTAVGCSPQLIDEMEANAPAMIAKALEGAREANDSVKFDREDWFGA